jgi:LPS-assembly protein
MRRAALIFAPLRLALLGLGLLAVVLALPRALTAQDGPAMLVADEIFLEGAARLVAQGRVEALAGTTRITARKITYERSTDTLVIEGPIHFESAAGDTTILAESGQMDSRFQSAILKGARLVLDQQVQLAAHQLARAEGRYLQLYKTAVTSCHICATGDAPLWQIRARRVVHDAEEKQLYFEGAQVLVRDVPVFYLPYLRLPDPSLKRASGFMIPSFSSSSVLGTGVRTPYFIRMGAHRDLTLAPYVSTKARSLEFNYRQAFAQGDIGFEGALSRDDTLPGESRGYLFAEGGFRLKSGFNLSFDLEATRDDSYLLDYKYSEKDRLDSEVALTRASRDSYTTAALVHYHSLRQGEDNATLPSVIGDFSHEIRRFPRAFGGELRLKGKVHSHYRYSDRDTDTDGDGESDGRDVARLSAEASWQRLWTRPSGVQAQLFTGLAFDSFSTTQDSSRATTASELTPMAALALRWPLHKLSRGGAHHVLEPFAQLGWVGGSTPDVANDESTRVEFDEGNLLDLSRFPAQDRRERGAMLAYGLNWSRQGPTGWMSSLTLAQILRRQHQDDFSVSSGLSGRHSDLLLSGKLHSQNGVSLTGRALLTKDLSLSKAEARGAWTGQRYGFGASYVWLGVDPQEERTSTVAELSLDGRYRISRHWTSSTHMVYDVTADQAAEAGLGLQYRNECVKIDLSLSRRFTSSTILSPATEMSLTVGLLGFNASSRDTTYARQCKD